MIKRVALAALLLSQSACSMSSSDTVKALPADMAGRSHVADIVVRSLPDHVSPDFRSILVAALRKHLAACAHGTQPLQLDVTVARVSSENPAKTILVGDSDVIKGSAQLIDPATGAVVGDYDIAHSIGGGGVLLGASGIVAGAAVMAYPEEQMADSFAGEICNRAFGDTN